MKLPIPYWVFLLKLLGLKMMKTVMIRLPFRDTGTIVLFILHDFDRIFILIDNSVEKSSQL